jgi:membrane associated rhomboid family serine protease
MGKNSSSINLMSQGSRQEIKTQAIILATFVAIFWLLEILDQFVFRGSLDIFGIIPHQVIGLRGILFAPFLHGDFPHLIANTVPFLILGWLVMLQETSDFFIVTGLTMLVGGLGVWLFAILLSILVFLLYGGTIWGVLPSRPGISWQGHLFGFLGGVLAAKLIATEKKHYP